jgi:hypothetical protein
VSVLGDRIRHIVQRLVDLEAGGLGATLHHTVRFDPDGVDEPAFVVRGPGSVPTPDNHSFTLWFDDTPGAAAAVRPSEDAGRGPGAVVHRAGGAVRMVGMPERAVH